MQDHHWNKKICIKHQGYVIFSSTDCQVLHYFHMRCDQQPHVGLHQKLQKVNFIHENRTVFQCVSYFYAYKLYNSIQMCHDEKNTKTKQNKKKEKNTQCVHQQSEYPSVI